MSVAASDVNVPLLLKVGYKSDQAEFNVALNGKWHQFLTYIKKYQYIMCVPVLELKFALY